MLIYIFLTTLYLSWLSYAHSFELYHDSGRVYLFGEDSSDKVKGWIKAIAKVTTSLKLDFIEYHDRLVISSFASVYSTALSYCMSGAGPLCSRGPGVLALCEGGSVELH